jgi:hypothetical protein
MKAMCGMCPANGELENGDPEAPVDFLCQVAHLRAHALGVSVAEHGACEYCPGGEGHAALMAAFDGATAAAPDRGSHPAGISKNRLPLLPADSDRPESDCGGGCGACGA